MKSLFVTGSLDKSDRYCTFKVRVYEKMAVHVEYMIMVVYREDGSGKSFIIKIREKKTSQELKGYYNINTRKGFIEGFIL